VLNVLTKITMWKINNTRIVVNEVETQDEKNHSGAAKPRISTIQKTLTCNPTQTLPHQVSYLKGSSMESFILGPSPKIDFNCSAATAHLQWLEREQISSDNFTK
jgi:hypothetical protein